MIWMTRNRSGLLCVLTAMALLQAGCPPVTMPVANENASDVDSGSPVPSDVVPIEVAREGSGSVDQEVVGSFLQLTATPEEGWFFDRWTGSVDSRANPLVVSPNASTSLTAVFVELDSAPPTSDSAPSDVDGDGIADENDLCASTPSGAEIDESGCSAPQRDVDGDGVDNSVDRCPNSLPNTVVDVSGCSEAQRDSDSDGVTDNEDECPETMAGDIVLANGCSAADADTDGDGVPNTLDRCPESRPGSTVDSTTGCEPGQLPRCGNNVIEAGEQCDPPNAATCDSLCQILGPPPQNDLCATPLTLNVGTTSFTNINAVTDGAAATGGDCLPGALAKDVWYCHTASCTGTITVSTCGTTADTLLAVYNGCACPSAAPITCSDDGCGTPGRGSRITFNAVSGQAYLLRLGGFQGAEGTGNITISCSIPVCGNSLVEGAEQCDPPNASTCDTTCRLIGGPSGNVCGNGRIDTGEQCEPPSRPTCTAACQLVQGAVTACNNGTIEPGEECDPPNGTTCGCTCRLITVGTTLCGNCIREGDEECDPPNGTSCGTNCRRFTSGVPVCGNTILETGEQCDPPDRADCDPNCRIIPRPSNNRCNQPIVLSNGFTPFSNTFATTDGFVVEPAGGCAAGRFESDIWYCHTASCSGSVTIELCGTPFDTLLAVYPNCGCPGGAADFCNDDGCVGSVASLVSFPTVIGQSFLVRIGGFNGEQGGGQIRVSCALGDVCGPGNGSCNTTHPNPGCDNEDCCTSVCRVDPFCCQTAWDSDCTFLVSQRLPGCTP
ncbi:MAG: thrombospondin type 3 repeat-containing protein [Planctomycetota bacterium]